MYKYCTTSWFQQQLIKLFILHADILPGGGQEHATTGLGAGSSHPSCRSKGNTLDSTIISCCTTSSTVPVCFSLQQQQQQQQHPAASPTCSSSSWKTELLL
jgi:hypothetical protein